MFKVNNKDTRTTPRSKRSLTRSQLVYKQNHFNSYYGPSRIRNKFLKARSDEEDIGY